MRSYNGAALVRYHVMGNVRDSLKARVAIDATTFVIEGRVGAKIDAKTAHEALCDRSGKGAPNCCVFGPSPPILIADGNRRVAFGHLGRLDEDVNVDSPHNAVDAEAFWGKVDKGAASRGFMATGQISPEYKIAPRLTSWAPYVAPLSRAGPRAYNTE